MQEKTNRYTNKLNFLFPIREIDPDILALTGILKGKVSDDIDLKEERYQSEN